MKLIPCDESRLSEITAFYHQAIAYLQTHINYPVWSSEHPSDESIKEAVRRGEQYICLEDDKIIGALLLSEDPDGDYDAGNWSRDLKQGDYLSVHVLAVSADCYQKGVGSFMVDECISIARSKGYQAVRLDIVPTNTPAKRLYQKKGFVYAGTVDLNRPTAPIPLFDLYELNFYEKEKYLLNNEYEKYADEAREHWGDTEAYKEFERRTARYTKSDWEELSSGMDAIMEGFAKLNARGVAPDHEKPRLQVRKLQQFICERMYPCSDEILSGLGQMYAADDRFKKNIDKHGEGTAAYVAECIKSYCG